LASFGFIGRARLALDAARDLFAQAAALLLECALPRARGHRPPRWRSASGALATGTPHSHDEDAAADRADEIARGVGPEAREERDVARLRDERRERAGEEDEATLGELPAEEARDRGAGGHDQQQHADRLHQRCGTSSSVESSLAKRRGWPIVKYSMQTRAVTWSWSTP
jgi:hypothetical protein